VKYWSTYVWGVPSSLTRLDGVTVAFRFIAPEKRVHGSDWPRPILPGLFPQSLNSFDDVRDGDNEHDDDRTAMAMAAIGQEECSWPSKGRETECRFERGSIRVGRKILWFVARKKLIPAPTRST
jgi:hypothetical protein